jgi:cysteine desulfurase
VARAYLDHASTTPPRPEAVAAAAHLLTLPAADPGRLHEEGRVVRDALEAARQQVADLLAVTPRQVVFTSGATEAINAAVWGITRGDPVRLAPTETLAVDITARLDVDALAARLASTTLPKPALVHCQWANHEVGTLQPVHQVVELCRAAGVPVHIDAAAAAGHLPLDLAALGADLVSLSAHKLGGLPGAGALIVRRGLRIEPLLVGGEQERARRGGLEALPALVAFGAAAAALGSDGQRLLLEEATQARQQIQDITEAAIAVGQVHLVGPPLETDRLPNLACLGVEGVEAEPVLIGLDRAGVAVHSGSACSSESIEPSPVLEAMGVDASHSLRVSVGWTTTAADVAAFAFAFPDVVGSLRALRG